MTATHRRQTPRATSNRRTGAVPCPVQSKNYVKRYPEKSGQWGPRPQFRLTGGGAKQHAPIEHGLAIRLRIPYPKARITDLRLNGWPIRRSETDGYVTWVARAYTYVQVNIPPETSKRQDFFLVTWEYDPGENRTLGWTGSGE